MSIEFAVHISPVPSWFDMPCIACEIDGGDGRATIVVNASSGLGLAACDDHTDVTYQVMRRLRSYELAGLRTSFVTAGIVPEPQHDRSPDEGAARGQLPGTGALAALEHPGGEQGRQRGPGGLAPVPLDRILYLVRLIWPDVRWVLREPLQGRPSLTWRGGPAVEEVAEELRWPDVDMGRTA